MKKWTLVAVFVVSVVCFADVTLAGVTMISQPYTFPYTIIKPGSYQLASNLTVSSANKTAILVKSDNVTIDLNGFAILGPTVCTSSPVTCSLTGTGNGIDARGHTNVKVSNGTVRGMGNIGVVIGDRAIVHSVRVESNGFCGIDVKGNGTVSGSTANYNGGDGIGVDGGTVSGSTVNYNGADGIYVGNGTVSDSTVNYNGGYGILVGNGTVSGGTANYNRFGGIDVDGNGTVSGSTANSNSGGGIFVEGNGTVSGSTANYNGGDGIYIPNYGTVSGNTSSSNSGYGLNLGSGVGYTNNVVNYNAGGTITGGVSLGFGNTNLCNGTTC